MPKNNIIKGKIKKRKASLGSGYAANVLRSLGYSARDVITDVMPNTASTVASAREAKVELDEALSMAAKKSSELASQGKSKLQSLKENELREAIEDIKSGKIYNKDRIKDDFNFDLDGFGDFSDFDEDFDSGDSSDSTNVTVDFDIPEDSPIVESQDATTATVSKSAEIITKENRANSIAIASSVARMSSGLSEQLQLVHSEVTKISTVVPKSITEHAALAARYYEDSIGYQKKIADTLDEIKVLYTNSTKLAGSTAERKDSALDKFSGLDLGSYKDLIKRQAKSTILDNPLVSVVSSAIDLYKMSSEMGGSSKGVAASGANMLIKALMGKGVRKNLGKIDSFVENLFLPVGMKIGKLQDSWDSPFKQLIGNIFGIKARSDLSVDKSKYEKGAVAFDGKVHRAITDVIPTYLRMITSALTGKEEIAFDYEKGVYNTVANIRKKFDDDIKNSVTNEYFSERWDFGRIVDKLDNISKEQGDQIKDVFDQFLFNMAKSSDLVTFRKSEDKDDIANLTGRSTDDPVVQIIRDYFEGMYDQGRHAELNEIFGRKSLNAKRNLEEATQKMGRDATSSNYYLIDNGLYSSNHSTVSAKDPVEEQLEKIVQRYGKHDPRGRDAFEQLQERKRNGQLGSRQVKADTIKLSNTGAGLGLDKYNRNSTSYLRDILSTLATGIKVVNVGTVEGGADAIISHSKKILRSLNLDEATFRAIENGKSTPSGDIGDITYDSQKAMDTFAAVLDVTKTEDDALDWIVKKFGDRNIVGRAASAAQAKRNEINKRASSFTNKVTGAGIDAIYGKRMSPSDDSLSGQASRSFFGPDGTPVVDPNTILQEISSPYYHGLPLRDQSMTVGQETDSASASTEINSTMITKFNQQLAKLGNSFNTYVIQPLTNALYDEDNGLVTKIEETELANNGEEQATEETKNAVAVASNKIKTGLFGEVDAETGEYKNGVLSNEANVAAVARTNVSKWTHELIYGSEDGKQKGLLSSVRSFFGEDENGKLNISGKASDAGKTLKDHLVKRAYEWSELIFGKEDEGEEKKLDIFLGDMKGKKGELAGAAAVGVLGSFFLPGGPITGALVGVGVDIVKNSTQLKDFLFGKQDEDGERAGGLVTKKVQDFFKENGHELKVGAGVGLLASFFLPGGPVGGALVGSALGLATKTEAFSKILYGEGGTKEDPTGGLTKFLKDHYNKDKDIKSSFLDAGIGAGVGILGSFVLPGGPIGGALLGAATNIAINTDKFKNWFFGEEDPDDNGKRKGGILGQFRDKIFEKAKGVQDWITDNITSKIKPSLNSIKDKAKNSAANKKANKNKPSEQKGADSQKPEEKTAEATTSTEKIVKEQLENAKTEHTEKMSILQKILDKLPFGKKGQTSDTESSATVTTGSSLTGPNPMERLEHNVDKITKSVDGQLNGVGYNINRIYKLLRKKLKKGEGDDDEDDDGDEPTNKKYHSFRDKLKSFSPKSVTKSIGKFFKGVISGTVNAIKNAGKKFVSGIVGIGKTILSIPKMLFNAAKKVLPEVGKAVWGVVKVGGNLLGNAIKGLGNVIEEGAKGFGNLIAGAFKGFGSLMQGLGIFGKETLTILGKGIKGVAHAGASIASSAVSAIAKKFGKGDKSGKITKFILDGGHLDYVSVVKQIGGSISNDSGTASNIINFPGSADAGEDASTAAFGGTVGSLAGMRSGFKNFGGRVRDKAGSIVAKAKGSIGAIKARFEKEDSEKEQKNWRERIAALLSKNTEDNKKHHSVWSSIFSKKGLITAGLVLMAPFLLKAVKGVVKFLGSGLWDSIKTALGNIADGVASIGGFLGIGNNIKEKTRVATDAVGLTDREEIMIDESTGTAFLDEDGNMVRKNMGKGSTMSRMKELFLPTETRVDHKTGKLYQESMYNHQTSTMLNVTGTATHLGAKKIKKGIKAAKEFAGSKAGKAMGSGLKKAAKGVGGAVKKAGTKVAGSDKTKTILKFCKRAVNFLIDKMGGVLKKFGCEKQAGNLAKQIGKLTSKVMDGKVIGKFIGKFAKPLAKVAAAAGTLLASDVAWAIGGAISGAANAGELFQVNPEDVDMKMRAIAAVFKGILNTSWAGWLDVIDDILFEIAGFSFITQIATIVYKLISPEEDDAKIDQLQDKFNNEYQDYLNEEYEAYAKNMQDSGKGDQVMSFDDFKSSELATSKADYNEKKNPSLGKRAFDAGKKVFSAVATPAKKLINHYLPHRDVVFMATDGTYYKKSANGNCYDYYSPIGAMLATGIDEADVVELVKDGKLTEKKKWVSSERSQKLQELGSITFGAFSDALKLRSKGIEAFKTLVTDSAKYWTKNIKEHGIFGSIARAFCPKNKGKGWFDTKGGYYVLNNDGETYNYYNANGDLVASDVDKEQVDEMKTNGLLTEADIIEDSDAQSAIKGIQAKVSELWKEAKSSGSKVIDNVKKWLGLGGSSVGNETLSAGKGDDKSAVASSSGTVNGFTYYSQNDPRFKDKAYKLSNGASGTMGERGCGPAAMSMVASHLTGKEIDPVTMANAATQGGYSISEGTTPEYFQKMASTMGISSANIALTNESIKKSLSSGTPIILQGAGSNDGSPFTPEGHYVVGVGLNGDNIVVNDPRGRAYSKEYNINDVISGAQNAWAFSNSPLSNNGSYNGLLYGNGPADDIIGTASNIGSSGVMAKTVAGLTNFGRNAINSSSKAGIVAKLRSQVVNAIRSREGQNEYTQGSQRTQVGSGYGDCSATAQWALKTGANIDPGGYSGAQYTSPNGIDVDNTKGGPDESKLMPGDLLFYKRSKSNYADGVGHVEMYVGDGKRMGHGSGIGPKETPLSKDGGTYLKARRFITDDASDYNAPALDPASATATSSSGSDVGLSSSQISAMDEESGSGQKSVLELLTGAASAFAAPILEWMTGKKASDESQGGESSRAESVAATSTNLLSGGLSLVKGVLNSNIPAASNVCGSTAAERAWNYYTGLGYSKPAVAGILGNAEQESGMNPAAIQNSGRGPAAGLFQWENYNSKSDRWKNLSDYANSKGKNWTDLDSQLEFGHKELMGLGNVFWRSKQNMSKAGTVPTTYEEWKNCDDVDMATRQFEGAFERAGTPNMDNRVAAAKKYYEIYKDYDPNKSSTQRVSSIGTSVADAGSKIAQTAGKGGVTPISHGISLKRGLKGGKGGSVTNINDSNRASQLENAAMTYTNDKHKSEEITNPLLRKAVELLGYIAENTSGINQGVKDLFDKEITPNTQIVDGGTHNTVIPIPQKGDDKPKDLTQYNTAKRISAGVFLT